MRLPRSRSGRASPIVAAVRRWRASPIVAAALLAITVVLVAPEAPRAQAPAAGAVPIGFDHASHEGKVVVAGQEAITCSGCHALAKTGGLLAGRPGHAACFGACHGAAPRVGVAPAAGQEDVCAACHAPADLAARRTAVAYPPYRLDPDFGLTMSHAAHGAVACTSCHRTPDAAAAPAKPHARCASCHDGRGAAAPMTACTTCHLAAFGANAWPRLVRGPLAVGAAYSHRAHAARTAKAAPAARDALECATCHAGIATATGAELPAPTMASCATSGCHDGAAAFATTVACRRCHTAAPALPTPVARPTERFSHDAHASRLAIDDCAACHGLDARGEPRSAGHGACVACHTDDFASRTPTKCGACHASTEPWRALTVDRMPPPSSDFGAALDHARHGGVACERCHNLDTATRQLRPPRGHVACAASGCHAVTGGPPPTFAACSACHALGRERARADERTRAAWSVRARFRHDVHGVDRDGDAIACTICHTTAAPAAASPAAAPPAPGAAPAAAPATVTMPPPPAKATCAPCHDGRLAFKMTGHGCARCHGEPAAR